MPAQVAVDQEVFEQVASVLPAGLEIVVMADRAYDIPAFLDRGAGHGWHWVVRVKHPRHGLCRLGHAVRGRPADQGAPSTDS